jgi:hypothetical protein
MPFAQQANAAGEEILVGAFDKITGVPFGSTMLGIVKSGEQSPRTPEALDARLSAVEKLLRDMEPRLRLVEQRLSQLQNEVVKIANISRLHELQRIRAELAVIIFELRAKPADPLRRALLEFRAQQQADLIKNNVDFDIWKWSDVSDQSVRTRFLVYPAFELYATSITTWFAAIELNAGDRPQRVVAELRGPLGDHATFLESRSNFRELLDEPVSLAEHLRNAAFCRLEAVDKFANAAGQCVFAAVCIDTMADKSVETDRQTLTMQPPTAGTLCTTNPDQSVGLKGEDELRAAYGSELMAALAVSLRRLATTGSLQPPFVGTFPNFIETQIFAVALDGPLLAPGGAAAGTSPAIPKCTLLASGACFFGVKLSQQTGWTIASKPGVVGATGPVAIRHNGSGLCMDVKNGVALAGAGVILFPCNGTASQVWNKRALNNVSYTLGAGTSELCATVVPAAPNNQLQLSRSLTLQPCNGGALQQFSNSDSGVIGPH